MSNKLIHCPACLSENLDNSVYCCQCGAPMRKGIPARLRKSQWAVVVLLAILLSLVMTAGMQLFSQRPSEKPAEAGREEIAQSAVPAGPQKAEQIPGQKAEAAGQKPSAAGDAGAKVKTAGSAQLVVGSVSIISPDGFLMAEFPAPVVGGSWLALPARACIGGSRWLFKTADRESIPVAGGVWGPGDAVGFWQLAVDRQFSGPGYATWIQELPVTHFDIGSGEMSQPMRLTPAGMEGAFIYATIPEKPGPGVFLQNGRVVGWTFGDVLEGAYMWTLGQDRDLLYTNYVDDFYRETFAGGREEYFSFALTRGRDASPQRQLQMFIEAFRLPPKLKKEETPRYLRSESVYPFVTKVVNYLMEQGAYYYIAPLADEPLLRESRDPGLLRDVVVAARNVYGTGSAVDLLEGIGADIRQNLPKESDELRQLHLELYLDWLRDLVDEGDAGTAWQVYDRARSRFAESPQLHLFGVELALTEGNWAEAESLLYQREYPAALRDRRELLAERITELKGRENKIVIGFAPGSRQIPVIATVNDRIEQNFLVDTGASFVTVPYSTVETLGLEDSMGPQEHEVQTAGGPVYARAVTLSSVELHGWSVPRVKALVLDLPDRPGVGLMGLNFLDRFRMDLQADEGLLILEPK